MGLRNASKLQRIPPASDRPADLLMKWPILRRQVPLGMGPGLEGLAAKG